MDIKAMLVALINLLFLKLIHLMAWIIQFRQQKYYFKKKIKDNQKSIHVKRQRKPEWVTKEIIRLKSFMVHEGCRKIADTFNRLYADKRKMTVGKTFVYSTIQKHRYEITVLRRKIRNKRPRVLPKNLIWSMDLTQVTDSQQKNHCVFGVIDSGTRACLLLQPLKTKASIVLLRSLLDTIERCGKPKAIRTDNEAVFTSRLFRFGLWLLNIRHQRTHVCCPWLNGRIERFFGTLKSKLQYYAIYSAETLDNDLVTYQLWYNHVRTHQYLNGLTPAEVWNGNKIITGNRPVEFSDWDGALTGIYFPPS